MSGHTRGHPYVDGVNGRSIETNHQGIYGVAIIQCGRCPGTFRMRLRSLAAPDIIDKKAKTSGWRLDPHVCPPCQKRSREDRMVESAAAKTPTVAAIAGQVRMHQLLEDRFAKADGRFEDGWDDDRIAKETGLCATLVTEYRRAAFGELKVPTEVEALQKDVRAMEQLIDETGRSLLEQLTQLRSRVAEVARKFAA